MSGVELALKGVSVIQKATGTDEGGINYTSDQITYPGDLQRVDNDDEDWWRQVSSRTNRVASIGKLPSKLVDGLFHEDDISFDLHGEFRAYFALVENDPDNSAMPVMANVYVDLGRHEKSALTTLEIHFTALHEPYGSAVDPKIRFVCDGHYDPAGTGDTRFRAVVEIDQNANVNLIESEITGGDGVIRDHSPNGFYVTIADD